MATIYARSPMFRKCKVIVLSCCCLKLKKSNKLTQRGTHFGFTILILNNVFERKCTKLSILHKFDSYFRYINAIGNSNVQV